MCGHGTLRYVNRIIYKGEFDNDNRHGHGELVYPERHALGKSVVGTKVLKRILPTGGYAAHNSDDDDEQHEEKKVHQEKIQQIDAAVANSTSRAANISQGGSQGGSQEKETNESFRTLSAVDIATAANNLAAEIARERAKLVPSFHPPGQLGQGVLKYRGDWGIVGGEIYNGPFMNDYEHGEAQWVVPTVERINGIDVPGRMVRRGTWDMGRRWQWVSYPVSKEQTKEFVDSFHDPKTFVGLRAEMVADGFPHLPDGVDNTDPAVKMIVGGLLRANASTAGAAVTHNIECELRSVSVMAESAATSLFYAREAFEEGKNELHDFLDDIDERRENIKNVKRDLLMLRRRVESHWRNDDMDLQTRYHKSVEAIHANPLKDWHRMRGMAPMKGEESGDEKIFFLFFFFFLVSFQFFFFFLF